MVEDRKDFNDMLFTDEKKDKDFNKRSYPE